MGLGKLGMGFVTCLMPDPLVNGFTTGVAVQVVTSQLKYILGIKIPRHGGVFKVIKVNFVLQTGDAMDCVCSLRVSDVIQGVVIHGTI